MASTDQRTAAETTADAAAEEQTPLIVAPLTSAEHAERLLPVLRGIARARRAEVVLVHVTRPALESPRNGAAGTGDAAPEPWVAESRDALAEAGVAAEVESRVGHNLAGVVREVVHEREPDLLLLAWRRRGLRRFALLDDTTLEDLLLDVPCDLAVLAVDEPPRSPRRVLLAAGPEDRPLAREIGMALAETYEGALTALTVLEPDAPDELVRTEHERLTELIEELDEPRRGRATVVRATSTAAGLLQAADPDDVDLLIVGAPSDGVLHRLALGSLAERVARRAAVPVLVVKRRPRGARSWLRRTWDSTAGRLPPLAEEEKAEVYRELRRASRGGVDFHMMIALSALIASFGLLLSSPAVVIGGMLVAPLMSPVLAIGLGVVHGDARVLRLSLVTMAQGALSAVLVGLLAAGLAPGAEMTAEVEARTTPGLLDLGVALGAGAAGAYALGRRSLSAALPGVAIAAALVPPLATGGIAIPLGDFEAMGGALLLFVTNLVAIAAAAGIVFLLLGFRPEPEHAPRVRLFGRGLTAMLLLVAVVAVPLGTLTAGSVAEARLDARVRDALDASVTAVDGLEWNRVEIEDGEGGALVLLVEAETTSEVTAPQVSELERDISVRLGRPVRLTLRLVQVSVLDGTPGEGPTEVGESGE